jgi:hypothetical protein
MRTNKLNYALLAICLAAIETAANQRGPRKIINDPTFLNTEMTLSGCLFFPVVILLFYCFYEHTILQRYPQNIISILLAFGLLFRTIWFFIYPHWGFTTAAICINRIAILFQFSSLTYLLLMWIRAMLLFFDVNSSSSLSKSTITNFRQRSVEVKNITSKYEYITLFCNTIVWIIFIVSFFFMEPIKDIESDTQAFQIYNSNIIILSLLAMFLAIAYCVISINLTLSIYRKLCINDEKVADHIEEKHAHWWDFITNCCKLIPIVYNIIFFDEKDPIDKQDKNQRKVLRSIMMVSIVLTFLFMLRSILFLYGPVAESVHDDGYQENIVFSIFFYPWFFYFVPELIPGLVICSTIAPPNSYIRKLVNMAYDIFCYCFKEKVEEKLNRYPELGFELSTATSQHTDSSANTSTAIRKSSVNYAGSRESIQSSSNGNSNINPLHIVPPKNNAVDDDIFTESTLESEAENEKNFAPAVAAVQTFNNNVSNFGTPSDL